MENKTEVSLKLDLSPGRALIFNTNLEGYYRVTFDVKNWEMIADLLMEDHTRMCS